MVLEVAVAVFVFIAVTSLCMTVLGQVPLTRPAEQRLGALRLLIPKAQEQDSADILKARTSSVRLLRVLLAHTNWSKQAAIDLERAGLSLRVGEYLLLRLIVAVITGLLALLLIGSAGVGLLFPFFLCGGGFLS